MSEKVSFGGSACNDSNLCDLLRFLRVSIGYETGAAEAGFSLNNDFCFFSSFFE
jgi:hypothetical protein